MARKTLWMIVMLAVSCGSNLVFATCQELAERLLDPHHQRASSDRQPVQVMAKVLTAVSTGSGPDLGKLERLLTARSKLGEVNPKEVAGLLTGVAELDARLGHSVLGEDVPGCLEHFSPEAMRSFVELFLTLGTIKSESDVLPHLEGRAQKVFGDTGALAHRRICAFTGVNPGLKCKILDARYSQACI